jgi:hypothetical protein
MSATNCTNCQAITDTLALFPGGICVECYAVTPEANAPITAQELARLWGARI